MRIMLRKLFERPQARVVGEPPAEYGERTVTLQVDGMVCDVWAGRVRRALEGLEGVDRVEVDLASGEVVVDVSGEMTNEELVKAVEGKVILSWARVLLAHPRLVDR